MQIEKNSVLSVGKKDSLKQSLSRHWLAYIFTMPAGIFLVVLLGIPFVSVVYLSFRVANLETPGITGFVGLRNYVAVLTDPVFMRSLFQGLVWTFGSVFGEYVVGLATAILLNQRIRGRAIFRAFIIIPWLVPIVVASLTWKWLLDPNYGIVDLVLIHLGIIKSPIDWFGGPGIAMFSIIFINVWRSFPFYTLMLLASLQAIPIEQYEAAELDGASIFGRFRFVTLRYLKVTSLILVVLNVIWVFNNFDFIWLLTQGGPLHETDSLATLTYKYSFQDFHFGQASAVSVVMIIVLLVMLAIYNRVSKES